MVRNDIHPILHNNRLTAMQIQIQINRTSALLSILHRPTAISPLLNYSSSRVQMLIRGIRTKKPPYIWHHVTGDSRLHNCYSNLAQISIVKTAKVPHRYTMPLNLDILMS
jgi:hypothetical protein